MVSFRTGLAFERGNEPDESTLVGIGLAVLQQFPLHLTEDKLVFSIHI